MQEDAETHTVNFFFIKFAHNSIDHDQRMITRGFQRETSVAVYRAAFGCTLVRDSDAETHFSQSFAETAKPDYHQDSVLWQMGNRIPDSVTGIRS